MSLEDRARRAQEEELEQARAAANVHQASEQQRLTMEMQSAIDTWATRLGLSIRNLSYGSFVPSRPHPEFGDNLRLDASLNATFDCDELTFRATYLGLKLHVKINGSNINIQQVSDISRALNDARQNQARLHEEYRYRRRKQRGHLLWYIWFGAGLLVMIVCIAASLLSRH
jgi:hypothetical protein